MKKILMILVIVVLVFAVVACGSKKEEGKTDTPATDDKTAETPKEEPMEELGEQKFTLEELKEYNGKDGKRAYVAVDGIVYDVTDSSLWKDGQHNGFEAGVDLTKPIKEDSPHGLKKLENVPAIGVLVK